MSFFYFRMRRLFIASSNLKLLLLAVLTGIFTICTSVAKAQDNSGNTVKAIVKDAKGVELVGVSVTVKGQKIGIATDIDGKFTLKVPSMQSVLLFTYIGFRPLEVVASEIKGTVVLTETSSTLNEVVVIGYGTAKVRDLTGSVGSVNIKDFEKAPVTSFDQALEGRIAGVNISSPDGQPGATSQITIRGGSVSQDGSPLFIIDGLPNENIDISSINPSDIASIDVLKDASSIAIYGARGANGVIIINTKRGQAGAPRISYSANVGFQQITKTMDLLTPYQYVKLQLDIDSLGSQNPTGTAVLTNHNIYLNAAKGITLDSYKNDPGYNWQQLVLRKAPYVSHNFSVSGGNNDTRYLVSGGYTNQEGIIINTGLKRFTGSFNLEQKLKENLRMGVNVKYTNATTYGTQPSAGTGGVVQAIWQYRPTSGLGNSSLLTSAVDSATLASFYSGTSTATLGDNLVNPLVQAENEFRRNINNSGNFNLFLEFTFFKDLKVKFLGGYSATAFNDQTFYNSNTQQGNLIVNSQGAIPNANGINGATNSGLNQSYLNENTVTYHKSISKSQTLDVLGGITYQYSSTFSSGFKSINIPAATQYLGFYSLNTGTATSPSDGGSSWQMLSYLGRVNYSIKSRYLLTVTDREDGSSKFTPGHQWGNFPSSALAWRFVDEPFLAKFDKFMSDGKLRISYGQVGNNRVGDFSYLSQYGSYNGGQGYPFNNAYVGGVTPYFYGNNNLTWETTTELDLGLDIGFFNQRLAFTADYYNRKTDNFLLNVTIPVLAGYPASGEYENIGAVRNRGFEFTVNTVNVRSKNFTWNTNFNISFNKSKILSFYDGFDVKLTSVNNALYGSPNAWIAEVGGPISEFYGYVKTGNYQYTDFNKLPNGSYVLKSGLPTYSGVQPGDPKFADLNGDGVIDSHDQTTLGSPLPVCAGGFNNNFSYKNFYLNIFMHYSLGNKIMNANKVLFLSGNYLYSGNQFEAYANRWTPTNPTDDIPRLTYGNTGTQKGDDGSTIARSSSWLIEDGSFLRLSTVSLGYNVPKKILSPLGIQSLNVFASVQNLYVFTKYSGLDPEVSTYRVSNPANSPNGAGIPTSNTGTGYTYIQPSSGYGALAQGYDQTPYPRARTFAFGLNVTL